MMISLTAACAAWVLSGCFGGVDSSTGTVAKSYSNCHDYSDTQSDEAYSAFDPLGNKGESLAVNNDGSFRPRGTPRNRTDLGSSAAPAASRRSCAGTST